MDWGVAQEGQSPATNPKHDDISRLGRIYDIITSELDLYAILEN